MDKQDEWILYIYYAWGIVDFPSYPPKRSIGCSTLQVGSVIGTDTKHTLAPSGLFLTQKQISYILAPFFKRVSAKPSCLKVSIDFGCSPSALPVEVLSVRSSTIVVLIPNRTKFDLSPKINQKPLPRDILHTYASIRPAGPAPTIIT